MTEAEFDVEAWVPDADQKSAAEATGAFARVVNLTEGYTRRATWTPKEREAVLSRARQLEDTLPGPTLHELAAADRLITGFHHIETPPMVVRRRWTWEQLCDLALHATATVDNRLAELAPAGVVCDPVGFLPRLLPLLVRRRGHDVLCPMVVPYHEDRLWFSDRLDAQWPECIERYRHLLSIGLPPEAAAAASSALTEITAATKVVYLPADEIGTLLPTPWRRFGPSRLTNVLREWLVTALTNSDSPSAPVAELITPAARLRRKRERWRMRRAYENIAFRAVPAGRYVAYFLHNQPEVTVEGWAFDFSDQVALVRSLAASLPADCGLVVKEHPTQAALRDPTFYGELLAIPGVTLIHHAVPSRDLARQGEIVVTLTGTIALESMCHRTPAIVLGEVYYEHFAGIYRARSVQNLRELIAKMEFLEPATDEQILAALASRWLASRPGGWHSGGRGFGELKPTIQTLIERFGGAPARSPLGVNIAGSKKDLGQ